MSYKLNNNDENIFFVSTEVNSSQDKLSMTEPIVDRSAKSKEKVAIRSSKNIYWPGFGNLSKGINIVSKSNSEHWLQQSYCSLLTPEEVAMEYGVK